MLQIKKLVEIPNVYRIKVLDNLTYTESCEKLEIDLYEKEDRIILRHGEFVYALDKNIPIFTNTRPDDCWIGKRYILPMEGCSYALVFSEHVKKSIQKDSDYIFDSNSNFNLRILKTTFC